MYVCMYVCCDLKAGNGVKHTDVCIETLAVVSAPLHCSGPWLCSCCKTSGAHVHKPVYKHSYSSFQTVGLTLYMCMYMHVPVYACACINFGVSYCQLTVCD